MSLMNIKPLQSLWDFDGQLGSPKFEMSFPRVDVVEKNDCLEITADLPGMKKEDITIEVRGGVLTMKGERKKENVEEAEDKSWRREERHWGTFTRRFALPSHFVNQDNSNVSAKYEDGELRLKLARTNPSDCPDAIMIE
eukprot:TRINITY_DN8678_c0_g1_i1.p3 TRINITY_DN8678_c0_g1~~TRINITY_DN8678_c0_g1_i1.p3  ORF type:complete len:139 (+),score=51.23 TRINITY_DN8678_c0_g1_i1:180-596(+)